MIAQYDGICAECHERITANLHHVTKVAGNWIHRACAEGRWGE